MAVLITGKVRGGNEGLLRAAPTLRFDLPAFAAGWMPWAPCSDPPRDSLTQIFAAHDQALFARMLASRDRRHH